MATPALLPAALLDYVDAVNPPETPVQTRLRAETAALDNGHMLISRDQGALLALLIRLTGARRCLEIGTFTGSSALAIAAALPDDGRLICCDADETVTAIARRAWRDAGLDGRIDLHLGLAADTLAALIAEGAGGSFDFVFIDADKRNYHRYYEAALTLLRPGGLIALDNMLWHGAVADPAATDDQTVALRALARTIRDDSRVDHSLLTVGDGILLARKR